MDTKKSLLRALPMAAILAGSGILTGCGGIDPGDYAIYRVSFGPSDESGGCYYPDTEPLPNEASDSTTLRGTGTWIIYASLDEKYYLDTGAVTLEGTEVDGGYSFTGKTVDVEYDMPDGTGSKRTTTITSTVNITIDGDTISGSGVTKRSYACSGSTCGEKIPSCTETGPFVGTYVEDVTLNYDIAPPK